MQQQETERAHLFRNMPFIYLSMLVILRIAIGWHFLYEGVAKLLTPDWSSAGFLMVSKWIFSGIFHWIAATPVVLNVVDILNIGGLILIGLGLMFGCYTRIASIAGVVLLLFYYVANPPFIGMDYGVVTEGNYLIVDKNLVELLALCILAIVPTGTFLGIDRLLMLARNRRQKTKGEDTQVSEQPVEGEKMGGLFQDRREMLKNLASLPIFGAFVLAVVGKRRWESYEEQNLVDAVTSATIKTFNFSSLQDLQGQIPSTKIGNLTLSRVILGGNLIGGWAHARDLIYVSKLIKAYHHRDKIFETFAIAEKSGINTFLTNPILSGVIDEYWRRGIGKIQFISDCGGETLIDGVKKSIDSGAAACYTHGGISDQLVKEGKVEEIGKAFDLIRQNGVPAGIGCHSLETVKACVEYGLEPDFWMKTLHHVDYWSAAPEKEHDNIWCTNPEETIAFMKNLKQPWIAFKTLAAGAIHPDVGFRYAFNNGADFICVGMYDFQIVDDCNIALNVLAGPLERERPWMA